MAVDLDVLRLRLIAAVFVQSYELRLDLGRLDATCHHQRLDRPHSPLELALMGLAVVSVDTHLSRLGQLLAG
jgi:hypothetical protein